MDAKIIPFARPAKPRIEPPPVFIGPAEAWMLFGVGVLVGICVALMLGRLVP